MEDTSACIQQVNEVDFPESWTRMHGSNDSEYLSELSGSTVRGTETGEDGTVHYSSVEELTRSPTCTRASDGVIDDSEEEAEVSNVRVFKALQAKWSDHFFMEFNQGGPGDSTLQSGKKFAEGGQPELYHAHVKWGSPIKEYDRKEGNEWVLKVFTKRTFWIELQSQRPQGLLKFNAKEMENWKSCTPVVFPRFLDSVL